MSEQPPTKQQDQGPVEPTDPSLLGGQALQLSDDEVYKKKVEIVVGSLSQRDEGLVATAEASIIEQVGGHRTAERSNIWEAVAKQGAVAAGREVTEQLSAYSASKTGAEPTEPDAIDRVFDRVAIDLWGTTDAKKVSAGIDAVDFSAGNELDALIDGDMLDDPDQLGRATSAIRLLVAHGCYKLQKWGKADQLQQALALMESYAEWVPDFDPKKAGFDEAKNDAVIMLASLQADQHTKPNYQYAKPERQHLFDVSEDVLEQLRLTEAHMYLRYRDFDLPPVAEPASRPTEQ